MKYLPQFINGRRSKVLLLRTSLLLCLFLLIYLGTQYTSSPTVEVKENTIDASAFKVLLSKIYPRPDQLARLNMASTNYDLISTDDSLYHFLQENDYNARCATYFNNLLTNDPEMFIDPDYPFTFDKSEFEKFDKFKKGQAKSEKPLDPDAMREVQRFKEFGDKIQEDEQVLHNYISHIRIYDRCFVQDPDDSSANITAFTSLQNEILLYIKHELPKKQQQVRKFGHTSSKSIESKLFPWLSFEYPIFQRYDNKEFAFPQFKTKSASDLDQKNAIGSKIDTENLEEKSRVGSKRGLVESKKPIVPPRLSKPIGGYSFLKEYKSKLNGKGIVLSIADKHVDTTIRLFRLLRSLGNTLPIQIVYYDDLSNEAKDTIVSAGRDEFEGTPAQEIWFVNVKRSIKKKYLNKFAGFGNKILATLFNSFEEMILIDADTVLLKPPEFFFELQKYMDTGTLFFKDRSTFEFRPATDLVFFKKLMPSTLDTVVFGIPQVTDYTLNNDLFKGLSHYMESGLVVFNHKQHFTQPFIMAQLNFHHPVQARVYGEKELFWLSFAFSGKPYAFNNYYAASIGELTPVSERIADVKNDQTFKSLEICSNHPGHINDADEHTLLWFNSGFRHCGQCDKVNFESEFKSKSRYTLVKALHDFQSLFEGKVKITHAIIPPFDMNRRKAPNNQHEPERSWLNMRQYCSGYTWCAYSLMGGTWNNKGETIDTYSEGKVIEFTEEEIDHISKLGDVWTGEHHYKISFDI